MPPKKMIEARFVPSQHAFWEGKGKGCLEALRKEFPLRSIKPTATMRMTINREMTAFDVVINSLKTDARITKEDLVKIAGPDLDATASKLWLHTVSRSWPSKTSNKTTGIWGYKLDFLNFAVKGITENTPVKRKWMNRSEEEKYEIRRRCTLLKNVFTFIGANDKDRRQNLMKQLRDDIKKKHSSAAQKAVVDNFVRNSLTLAEDDTTTITLYHRPDDNGKERPPFNIKMFRWWSNSKMEKKGEGAAKRTTSLRKAFKWYEKNLENIEYWFDFKQEIIWPVAAMDIKAKGGWNTIKTLKIEKLYPKEEGGKVAAAAAAARDKNRSGEYDDRRASSGSSASSSSSAPNKSPARNRGGVLAHSKKDDNEEEEEEEEETAAKPTMGLDKETIATGREFEEQLEGERDAMKGNLQDRLAKNNAAKAAAKTAAPKRGGARRRRGGRKSKRRKSKRRKSKRRKKARKSKRRKSRKKRSKRRRTKRRR
jgi:hypothetical protein